MERGNKPLLGTDGGKGEIIVRKKINAAAGRVAKGTTGRARRLVGKTKRGFCATVETTKKAARKTRDEICESKWFGLEIVVICRSEKVVGSFKSSINTGRYTVDYL